MVAIDDRCTGIIVDKRLVLYAAHCGTRVKAVASANRVVEPVRCESYPVFSLPVRDIAYCLLDSAIVDDEFVVAPALGCELEQLGLGSKVIAVGMGAPRYEARSAELAVTAMDSTSLTIEDVSGTVRACAGDSGGPVLMSATDGITSVFRAVGLISAGSSGCGPAPIAVARLGPVVEWIEARTGIDISPCGHADGTWDAGERCVSFRVDDDSGCRIDSTAWELCGPPHAASVEPNEVGSLSVVGLQSPIPASAGSGVLDVEIVDSRYSQLVEVNVQVRARDSGAVIFQSRRTLPPFRFGPTHVAVGEYELVADARSAVDDQRRLSVPFDVVGVEISSTGCNAPGRSPHGWGVAAFVLISYIRIRWSISRHGGGCSS